MQHTDLVSTEGRTGRAGRSCPLHYRYAPDSFAGMTPLRCETLYVVGGLYGNEPALDAVLDLFEREPGGVGAKRLVFNGDFNWFNVETESFARLNRRVLAFDALRGNVETELAAEATADDDDAGCGCAYPDWVGDDVVTRSNRILRRLRATAQHFAPLRRQLGHLPMACRAQVGGLRVGIVHGDAESLSGWGFAQEHLGEPQHRQRVRRWFDAAQVDAFACSHTCLPVFRGLPRAGREHPPLVLNNGAAGMPNFRGDGAGLLTRISLRPFEGPQRRFGLVQQTAQQTAQRDGHGLQPVHIDAIAIEFDRSRWAQQFLQQWPPGSDAHASYGQRISQGPAYALAQALDVSEA